MILMLAEMSVASDSKKAALDLCEELAELPRRGRRRRLPRYDGCRGARHHPGHRAVQDGAAVDAHMSSDHFESFQAAIASHLAGEPELYRYEVDSETRVM